MVPEFPNACAAEFAADDGVDPKRFHDRRPRHGASQVGRKALQLCGQVELALRAVLAQSADDALRNLTVLAVRPAPHTGRLRIEVAVDPADGVRIGAALDRAGGWLRTEVAAAIHRRKAPELFWQILP